MSNLMAMPGFDLGAAAQLSQPNSQPAGQSGQPKLKVKPGLHLLDPLAMQRRLLNAEELPEVVSTTNGIEDPTDPNASLWHPLFGK